jgi:hypothetical protein
MGGMQEFRFPAAGQLAWAVSDWTSATFPKKSGAQMTRHANQNATDLFTLDALLSR